jgi:hypothetical protein
MRAINESKVRTSIAGCRPDRGIRTAAQAPPPRSWRHPSIQTAGSWVSHPKFYDEYNVKYVANVTHPDPVPFWEKITIILCQLAQIFFLYICLKIR